MKWNVLTGLALATTLAASLATAPAGMAQPRDQSHCPPGQRNCTQQHHQPGQGGHRTAPRTWQHAEAPRQAPRAAHREAPRVGQSARGGQPFHRAHNSRFRAPPRGQEYRVVNDHLVLVDSRTLKVVTVLGLLGALTR